MNAQQLKNAILQEAIEGRLVPQDPNDEPASALLERIRKEKEQLVKEGKLKKKDLEVKPISEDEIPFEIPESWEWVRVGDISESYIGLTYKPSDVSEKGWIVLRSSNIQDGKIDYNDIVRVNVDVPTKLHVRENDIIICARNGSKKLVGKSAIVKNATEPMTFGAFMAICRTDFYLYMSKYLLSPLFFEQLRKDSGTTTINQLTQKNFNNYLVPLPPLAEQKRIVAKIEGLLPKVEEYGKAQEALNKLNEELPERLKKSILQEAIEGRLVPQDLNDEPASVLLNRIREEKQRLVKEGKLKKKDLIETPITEDEIPFDIPESWEWCRLRDVLSVKSGEFLNVRSLNDELNYPVYGGNGINGTYDKYNVESDTLIIGRVGFYCGSIHKTFSKAWVTDNALIVTFAQNNLYVDYLQYVLGWLNIRTTSNSTAQPVVSGKGIYPLLFPLPPLAEQHRIVAKIEEVFAEIDKLKE